MQKAARWVLIFVAGVLGVAAFLLIAINLYFQSQGTQARVQQELSERLGTTLRLSRISVTPWGGLKLSGITIPQADPAARPAFLQAKTFRLRIQWASIFADRLVIKEISFVAPNVYWAQNPEGRWLIPEMPPPPISPARPAGREPDQPVPADAQPAASATAPGGPLPTPASKEIAPGTFIPEIKRVTMSNANFHFLDAAGKPVAAFESVDFRSGFRTAQAVRGNVSIGRTSLRNKFFIEDLRSPLQYAPEELAFSQISGRAAGGEIEGNFSLLLQAPGSPFTVTAKFHDLQADTLVKNAGGPSAILQGKLEGFLAANGKTAEAEALHGAGEIRLRDGEIQNYSLLILLSKILQIPDLADLHLEQADIKYRISPGVVAIDELMLRSPNIHLSANGTISFDGKLHLDSQLALSEAIRHQLFRPLRANFQPASEQGFYAVGFQVTGTIERPKTDLMDKLVGRDLKDIGSIIGRLFGGSKGERPKRKSATKEAPPVAPTAPASSPEEKSPDNPRTEPTPTP